MPNTANRNFEQVFDQHFEQVYSYVAYRVSPDREAAKDLAQEVFLAALKSWNSYRGDGPALSWLRSIARNKVADHFRKLAAGSSLAKIDLDQFADGFTSSASGRQDRAALVSLIIRRLPHDYAELLEQKYQEGLSVKQIARLRKTTEKAVASALTRARDSFRKIFAQIQNGEE